MKLISYLLLIVGKANAHEAHDPSHALTSTHHGSPVVWLALSALVIYIVYEVVKAKK